MAFSSTATGPTTADGTEQTLQDITSPAGKVYQIIVYLTNMTAGDHLTLKAFRKADSVSGTLDEIWVAYYAGPRGASQYAVSPYFVGMNNIKFTLQQTAGTNRSYEWEIIEQG
jgi:hypothetical protein